MSSQQNPSQTASSNSQGDDGASGVAEQGPPMTATLMGRLFIVPAIVVCVMLGVAVVVVLFGTSSLERPQSIDDLLDRLQADSGDKSMGLLFPEARESWQAAQELARRLEEKDKALDAGAIDPVARRIISILASMGTESQGGPADGPAAQRGHARKLFLIAALGQLETPVAVEPLAGLITDADPQTRQAALQAIARMSEVPETREALPIVYASLDDSVPAVRMIACLTVAMVAERGDAAAIGAVARHLESDRETQWNAALALARLGSKRGKLVLMNMLDRSFWEGIDLDYEEDGVTVRRKFTAAEIDYRLRAAIDAASHLDDEELRQLVIALSQQDTSHTVRDAALRVCEESAGGGSTEGIGPGLSEGIHFGAKRLGELV
jgi:HEAT repeat protein